MLSINGLFTIGISIDPQPFPITERGGNKRVNKTLQKLIFIL